MSAMTPTMEEVRARAPQVIAVAKRRGSHNVRVIGSVARGDATEASDIDFLVDFDPDRSLFDQVGLENDLASLLGRSVHVMEPPEPLGPREARIRARVLADAVPL